MSVRQMIAQLTEAKSQLQQAKATGGAVATSVSAAKGPAAAALDGVQDKTLAEDIDKHARDLTTEINGIDALIKSIDGTIQRAQGIGARRR
jgi:hypothetical protein